MGERCFLSSISAAHDQFVVQVADRPELVEEAFRIRHQVYCIERGFETGLHGMESDGFDHNARHVLLRRRATQDVVGTVRVVLPGRTAGAFFPMQQVCGPILMRDLPLHSTGEISRFALSKDRRVGAGEAGVLMRLGLMQGIVKVSADAGLTHWCAVMERSLLRLLQATAIYFQPIGTLVEYHGIRQPAGGRIETILDRIRRDATPVWEYITQNGNLWPADAVQGRLAA